MVKRWLPWVLKGGLSAGLIWFVFGKVDLASAWQQAKEIDPAMLAVAYGLMVAQIILGAVRWDLVLKALAAPIRFGRALAIFYIAGFFSLVLPGAVGGDAVRMWKARREGLSLSISINSVMLERLITVFALVLLVAVTQPVLLARVPDLPGAWVFPAMTVVGLFGMALLTVLDRLPNQLGNWRLGHWRVVRALAHLAADTRRVLLRPRFGLPILLVALVGHVNLSLVVYALAVGLGLDVDVIDCMVLVPPVILIMTLPISIAGWGVRETAMVTAFGLVGVEDHAALVLSVIFGLVNMAGVLPGGGVWLLSGDTLKRDEIEATEQEAEKTLAS
ncbi:MAG: flippase-like domain-containing protein [Magnetospirillum sp.]|nr:flippase-like domain-containing protein [Magnetospirillum sp.]